MRQRHDREDIRISSAGVTVREAGPRDYRRSYPVIRETFEFHRAALPDIFRETHRAPPTKELIEDLVYGGDGAFLIAESDSEVVGFLTIRLAVTRDVAFLVPRRWAMVENIGVTAAWQGKGVGHMLMEGAESWAARRGATEVQLTVWDFNTRALGLYNAVGYVPGYRLLRKRLQMPEGGDAPAEIEE